MKESTNFTNFTNYFLCFSNHVYLLKYGSNKEKRFPYIQQRFQNPSEVIILFV